MNNKFVGFDEPPKNENFFELLKDGEMYISLYHDCKVTSVEYVDGKDYIVEFEKVHDTGYGPAMGSKLKLSFEQARINSASANADGNFEDLDEIVYIKDSEGQIEIAVTVSGIKFVVLCSKLVLSLKSA